MRNKYYIYVLLFILIGCKEQTPVEVPPRLHGLKIPQRGIDISLVQRHSKQIEGYQSNLNIAIDDITAGQTVLSLSDSEIFLQQSIQEGDTLKFSFDGVAYIIGCKKLINHLLGEDNAIFSIVKDSLSKTSPMMSESEKIEKLLYLIAHADLIFIRNGSEHSGSEAAAHLRKKWNYAKGEIHTVNDFIRPLRKIV